MDISVKMNEELQSKITKTGTSIVGIACKDGIVMASDRQVTAGMSVAFKRYKKLVEVNPYLLAGVAGLVSDAQLVAKLTRAELKLKELKTKTRPTVKEGANLFAAIVYQNIRKFSPIPGIVALIIGGFDEDGATKLFSVDPAGAVYDIDDYVADGSGVPFMLGVLEKGYKKNISVDEGIELAKDCLRASTQRDLGSGFGMDIYAIKKDSIKQVFEKEIEAVLK